MRAALEVCVILPEHMDRWSRNQRLYETLKGMGLYIVPIPEKDDPTRINHLVVATDLPFAEKAAEEAAKARILAEMKRTQVREIPAATDSDGDNVVDFPAVS